MVPNQIVRDFNIGALTVHSTEDTYQWHTVLPAGYLYYVEDCYVMSQTDVAAGTTNVLTFQLNDEDGNLICSAPGSTAIPATGLAFTSLSSTYRWIDCTEAAENLFVSTTCSGEGQTFTNSHIVARISIHKPGSGG